MSKYINERVPLRQDQSVLTRPLVAVKIMPLGLAGGTMPTATHPLVRFTCLEAASFKGVAGSGRETPDRFADVEMACAKSVTGE